MAFSPVKPGGPRSEGAIPERRIPRSWPKDRRFRILSLDGGGIRGVFPAAVLAGLEQRFTAGRPIGNYFDLVAGTSTGGIMALGLGRGLTGADLLDLYVRRGIEIFPRPRNAVLARIAGWWNPKWQFVTHLYESEALRQVLVDLLGERLYGDSELRLCIPSFDGKNSEVFVYKTPHHRDYTIDRFKPMVDVGMSTSAAPTFFKPHQTEGYVLVDGGVWANNPIMIALVEALTSFDVGRDQIDILSIGCSDERYTVGKWQLNLGGNFAWAKIMLAAMRLQSLAATNQARLLLGPRSVVRIDPPAYKPSIGMDDHARAIALLPAAAHAALDNIGAGIAEMFLKAPADSYTPEALPPETTV